MDSLARLDKALQEAEVNGAGCAKPLHQATGAVSVVWWALTSLLRVQQASGLIKQFFVGRPRAAQPGAECLDKLRVWNSREAFRCRRRPVRRVVYQPPGIDVQDP